MECLSAVGKQTRARVGSHDWLWDHSRICYPQGLRGAVDSRINLWWNSSRTRGTSAIDIGGPAPPASQKPRHFDVALIAGRNFYKTTNSIRQRSEERFLLVRRNSCWRATGPTGSRLRSLRRSLSPIAAAMERHCGQRFRAGKFLSVQYRWIYRHQPRPILISSSSWTVTGEERDCS